MTERTRLVELPLEATALIDRLRYKLTLDDFQHLVRILTILVERNPANATPRRD